MFDQAKSFGYEEIKENYIRLDTDDARAVYIFKVPFNHDFVTYHDDILKNIWKQWMFC
jgi:hypothetical protein